MFIFINYFQGKVVDSDFKRFLGQFVLDSRALFSQVS